MMLALGVGYWLGGATPNPESVPAVTIDAPAVGLPVAVEAGDVQLPPVGEPLPPPEPALAQPSVATEVAPVTPPAAEVEPARPPSSLVVAPEPEEGDGVVTLDAVRPPSASEGPAPRSGLDTEVDLYDGASALRDAGDYIGAVAAYNSYILRYPSGHLAHEARLSILECFLETGAHAEAVDMAAALVDDPSFTDRRRELLLVQAESLLRLDRCPDALAIVDTLGARDARAMAVRRECRRRP